MKKIEKESQQTITSLVTNSQIVMHAVTGFQKVSSRPPCIYHPSILKIRYASPKGYIIWRSSGQHDSSCFQISITIIPTGNKIVFSCYYDNYMCCNQLTNWCHCGRLFPCYGVGSNISSWVPLT